MMFSISRLLTFFFFAFFLLSCSEKMESVSGCGFSIKVPHGYKLKKYNTQLDFFLSSVLDERDSSIITIYSGNFPERRKSSYRTENLNDSTYTLVESFYDTVNAENGPVITNTILYGSEKNTFPSYVGFTYKRDGNEEKILKIIQSVNVIEYEKKCH